LVPISEEIIFSDTSFCIINKNNNSFGNSLSFNNQQYINYDKK